MEETAIKYQQRMVAAHKVLARIEDLKAAIYTFWQHKGEWDNDPKPQNALIDLYNQCDEARDAVQHGTNVAHYG